MSALERERNKVEVPRAHLSVKNGEAVVILVAEGKEEPRENSRRVFLPLPRSPSCAASFPRAKNPSSSLLHRSRAQVPPPSLNTLSFVNFRSIELWSRMQLRFDPGLTSRRRVGGRSVRCGLVAIW